MTRQKMQFFGFCAVFTTIILFSVLVGGYTSFWRSKNRIEGSKTLITNASQKRLDLVPNLIELTQESIPQVPMQEIDQTAQKAAKILHIVISQPTPLDKVLIKDFEISESQLTTQLKEVFIQLETLLDKKQSGQFSDIKNQFFSAQNNLFVAGQRYNDEVNYFNIRKEAFWTSFIAKLFGFNELYYIKISEELFLPAKATFAKNSS